jgi:hypothetical protein
LRHAAVDHQLRLIDAAQFLGIRVHVDQALGRHWRGQQRVAAGGHLAEARADGQDHIGFAHARRQFRIDADADVADVVGMCIVQQILEAEGARYRQVIGFGKALDIGAGLFIPAAAAQQHQRFLAEASMLRTVSICAADGEACTGW